MKTKKDIKVAYIGQVAPFEPEFYNEPGYGRPGSLAQLGWIEALHNSGLGLDRAWGFRPIAHWPRAKIQFEWIRRLVLPCGAKLTLLPLFNHFFLREISRFFILAWLVIHWGIQRRGHKRVIVMYNMDEPNGLVWMRLLTWITRTKLVPIIYDMAQMKMYGKRFIMHFTEPDWLDRLHERMLPLCDGLFPITDAIPQDFALNLKYLRVDGGIGEAVVANLPELTVSSSDTFTIFYAGGITPWNRVDILLEYMERNRDPSLRLWLAGGGRQEQLAKDAAAKDTRITFFGFLGPEKLNELYGKADMLVTLRDLIDPGLKYHYPSKTFEMLAMGKPLVITNSQHTKKAYGEYCYVIDKCTLEDYSKGVDFFRAMSPQARYEYGKKARLFAIEHKRWIKQGPAIGRYIFELTTVNKKNSVIINADDFGKDEMTTLAIAESFRKGYINQTTLMVNMPWTEKAVLLAKEEGFADKVGLHLNLTESVSGEKATMPSDMSALRKEICLQIEKFLSFGLKSRHCDSHHHVHFRPKVAYALMPLLKRYGFKSVRRPYNMSLGCTFGGMVRHMRNGLFVAYAWLNGLETTKLFGGVSDVENINDIEIMVHPVYSSSGQLFNAEQFDKSTGKPLFGRPMSDLHSIRVAI